MKKSICIVLIALIAVAVLFVGCEPKDEVKPKIHLYGMNKIPIKAAPEGKFDTVILLHSKYTDPDPAVWYDDNKTPTDEIKLTSDIEEVFNVSRNNWYVVRTANITITYTATDEAGLSDNVTRRVRVANVSEAYSPYGESTVYALDEKHSENPQNDNVSYNMTITTDNAILGVLRLPRVYYHYEGEEVVYYNVRAYLYSPLLSDSLSSTIGYMGHKDKPSIPFFDVYENSSYKRTMTYQEAKDTLVSKNSPIKITHLKVPPQVVLADEATGSPLVTIQGIDDNGIPQSTIEYIENEPYKITLKILVSDRRTNPASSDRVTEVYLKRYLDELY